jgi:hypothetical protein
MTSKMASKLGFFQGPIKYNPMTLILQSSLVYDIGKGPIKTRFYLRTYLKKKVMNSINVMQTKLGSLKAIRKRS